MHRHCVFGNEHFRDGLNQLCERCVKIDQIKLLRVLCVETPTYAIYLKQSERRATKVLNDQHRSPP